MKILGGPYETFRSALGSSLHRCQCFRVCLARPPASGGLCRQSATPTHTGRRESALRVHAHRIRLFVCGAGLDLRSRYSTSTLARSRTPLWLCGVDADLASLVPDVLRGSAVARSRGGKANFI